MDCFKVLLYLTSYICCLSMLTVGSVGLTRAFTQVFHTILQKAWMNFLANPVFAWIKKKTLDKMQLADPRGSFYISENIMGLGILTHQKRLSGWFDQK